MSDDRNPPRKPRFFPLSETGEPNAVAPKPRSAPAGKPDAAPRQPGGSNEQAAQPDQRITPTTVDIAARFAPQRPEPAPGGSPSPAAGPAPRQTAGPTSGQQAFTATPQQALGHTPPPEAKAVPRQEAPRETPQPQQALPRDAGLHRPREKTQKPAEAPADEPIPAEVEADTEETVGGRTLPTLKDIKRGFRWSAILLAAVGGLIAMSFTNWLYSFVAELVVRQDWIGWLALGLTAIALTALLAIILRELFALARLKRLGALREHAGRALTHDDRAASEKVQSAITGMLGDRRSLAWGLAALKEHKGEVLSARDRLTLVERNLMAPLDRDAHRIVADSAKRVSVMTAISPFVFLDMLLVAMENLRMLRRLMSLYGGRPGVLSQFKMVQMMVANLALTGGVAVGADLLSHVMGRQVATRLAGRLGEGFVNGSLTARLGITATKLIRPLPYIESKPVSVATFIKELTKGSKVERDV